MAKRRGEKEIFVADQIDDSADIGGLAGKRPFEQGYLTNIDLEREVWDRVFNGIAGIDAKSSELTVTEPVINFPSLSSLLDELIFEEMGFQAACIGTGPGLSLTKPPFNPESVTELQGKLANAGTGLVIDAGFSFCHAAPVFEGKVFKPAVRRLDVGGKKLTNYLMEQVSYRSLDLAGEFFLVEECKEQACFVSQLPERDLRLSRRPKRSPLYSEWVLPDGVHLLRGYLRSPSHASQHMAPSQAPKSSQQQFIGLANERFLTPELLFSPQDIGLHQPGLPELAADAISHCPETLRPLLCGNVVLTGGSSLFPGFEMRLGRELRRLLPSECTLNVKQADNPLCAAWEGASAFAASPDFDRLKLTKQRYSEIGSRLHLQESAMGREYSSDLRPEGRVT